MSDNNQFESLFKIQAKTLKATNVKNNKSHFTLYFIQISTEFKTWIISKRYNDFFELE